MRCARVRSGRGPQGVPAAATCDVRKAIIAAGSQPIALPFMPDDPARRRLEEELTMPTSSGVRSYSLVTAPAYGVTGTGLDRTVEYIHRDPGPAGATDGKDIKAGAQAARPGPAVRACWSCRLREQAAGLASP